MFRMQSKIITDTEPVHEDVYVWTGSHGTPYHRFNVQTGLEKTRLDEWTHEHRSNSKRGAKMSTLQYLEAVTDQYLNGEEHAIRELGPKQKVSENLAQCAKMLVAYRRARQTRQSAQRAGAQLAMERSSNTSTSGASSSCQNGSAVRPNDGNHTSDAQVPTDQPRNNQDQSQAPPVT